jgi:hypothetical protein
VAHISTDGFLAVLDESGPERMEMEVRPPSGFKIPPHTFYRDGQSISPDEQTLTWMTGVLKKLIGRFGLGAEERGARFLANHGVTGLLDEVSRLEGGCVKAEYLTVLFQSGEDISAPSIKRILTLTHDLNETLKARILTELIPFCVGSEELKTALKAAVMKIDSEFERSMILIKLTVSEINEGERSIGPLLKEIIK